MELDGQIFQFETHLQTISRNGVVFKYFSKDAVFART